VNLTSHLLQRLLKLPPPLTRDLIVERDLEVPMPDGVVLLADRWTPRAGGHRLPTALLRSPYGRSGLNGVMWARPLAERGVPGANPKHAWWIRFRRHLRPSSA
jgi:predicted acyl esterase